MKYTIALLNNNIKYNNYQAILLLNTKFWVRASFTYKQSYVI